MLTPLHCLMLSLRLSKADFTATLHYSLIVCSHSTSGENGGLRCCRSCPERIAGSGVERARKGPQNTLGGRAGDRTLCVCFLDELRHSACVGQLPGYRPACPSFSLPPHPGFWNFSPNTWSLSFEYGLGEETEIAVSIGLAAGQKLGPPLHSPLKPSELSSPPERRIYSKLSKTTRNKKALLLSWENIPKGSQTKGPEGELPLSVVQLGWQARGSSGMWAVSQMVPSAPSVVLLSTPEVGAPKVWRWMSSLRIITWDYCSLQHILGSAVFRQKPIVTVRRKQCFAFLTV